MFRLDGKKALVTGATGGLGRAIAHALVAQGATVFATGTKPESLEKLQKTLGSACHTHRLDLKDLEAVDQLANKANDTMGGLDILVNNAGLTRDQLLIRMKNDDYHDVMTVNLEAPFRLMRAAAKIMMKQRWGRIVNISSVVGTTGNPGQANYCASKGGLVAMSKAIAFEMASRGITVNCVAPGFIASPMTQALTEEQQEAILRNIPLKKMGQADDIASAVVYLSSPESAYITGQTLHVNGGMAML